MKRIQTKSLLVVAPSRLVAVLFGILDSSVWLMALLGNPEQGLQSSLYYAIAIPLKAATLLFLTRIVRPNNAKFLWPLYLPIGVTVFASVVMGNTNLEGVVQPIGALGSLAMTAMVLSDENLAAYMKAFGLSCLMSCAVFLFQFNFVPLNGNGIVEQSGRYSFISGTQPNFGGEFLVTGFLAFCMARVNIKVVVATFVLYLVSLNLMQSRAAMLSIFIGFSVYIYGEKIRRFSPASRLALTFAVILLAGVFFALNTQSLSDLFLLQDENRGFGSGYVGREEHWEAALSVFLQSPFFGIGFGYFRHDVVTPHSMWLAMLSMMGAMGFFVLVAMWKSVSRIYAANKTMFLLLLAFIPMTIFNDRFLNLNPYPFLLFVVLFLPERALRTSTQRPELGVAVRRSSRESIRLGPVR